MDYASKQYRLESLYTVQSMIVHYLSKAETDSAKKEWQDKLDANRKEIEAISPKPN